jgi:CheY-like chemotaxis protein
MTELNTDGSNRKKLNILVAEDNEINQKLIQQILEKAGIGVNLVDNGRQAVEAADRFHYDMIIMDIQMPVMDGYAAAREIRNLESETRNVPMIAMTGTDLEDAREKCLDLGMNDCLGKPLFREQLLSSIEKWTGTELTDSSSGQAPEEVGKPVVKKMNTRQPIDLDRALDEFMGEKEVLYSVLNEFVAKVRSQMEAIQRAFLSLDFKEIAREAHSIKGGAANLTANKVAGIASALEKAAGLSQAELARQLIGRLEDKLLQLESYLQSENISVHGV